MPGTSRASFKGRLGKTNKGVESRASVMGTYASDDSDDEGSVVSVVHHGELASVAERRATQIRHVLRDGPPDSEEDTPPAVRVRRGDLDPFALQRRASAGTSSRVDAGRGPSRLSRRGEHANRDRHVVWRDERTTEGDPEGFGSRRRDAYGRRRRSIRESSPPRYRDARGDAYVVETVAETVADVRQYASPTLLAAPECPEPGRVASLARRYEDPRLFDPEPFSDVPEFRLGVERRNGSPGGLALNTRASTKNGVDATREALDDVARHLRDAHERSAEKVRALARAVDAREDRLAESARALRDVQRRLTGVLAAVDGDEAERFVSERLVSERLEARTVEGGADLDARGAAPRAAAAERAAEARAKREREEKEKEARAARARAETEAETAARAEAETARARAARPSAAVSASEEEGKNARARAFAPRERPDPTPREASAATLSSRRLGTRSAALLAEEEPEPKPEPCFGLSRTRGGLGVPSPTTKLASEVAAMPPGGRKPTRRNTAGAANEPPPAEATPALTRAGRAPAEQTPAIPRERLVERFPEKTPTFSVRAARAPAGALALTRTRHAVVTMSATKPSAGGVEAGAKETSGAGSTAGLTRARRRVGPTSPAARPPTPGPEPSPSFPSGGIPGGAPTLRDGMSLAEGADGVDAFFHAPNASNARKEANPAESRRGGLSRTRALGGETRLDLGGATSAASASDVTFVTNQPPVDSRAAAVAQSRMVRTRR